MNCELCGKREDERNIQEQVGFYLCLSCDCKHSDNELLTIMEEKGNGNLRSTEFRG